MKKDLAHEFPQEFYDAIASGGWLGMTIPEAYGGHGLGITEATLLLEEVARSGAAMNGASAIHLTIFGMQPVVKHGSDELKAATLSRIVNGICTSASASPNPVRDWILRRSPPSPSA